MYFILKIESLDDFKKSQIELFKQEYIWITGLRKIETVSPFNDFPLYIFVNGDNSIYYKRDFYYECTRLLDNGSIIETVLYRQKDSKKEKICPKIFDIYIVDKLFNYQTSPTYQPKKFNGDI